MSGQAYTFMSALFGDDELADAWLYLWTLPDKRTHWFRSIDEAAQFAEACKGKNVYVGLGLSPEDYGPDKRCLNEKVVGISGVRADIDIASGVAHSKGNLPPDLAAARSILAKADLKPTLVVHSGYGLQAYWLFKEPWTLDNDVERQEAATLLKAWNDTIRHHAQELGGWDVDATHDLARVFRVPGSFNLKDPDNPRPVTILEHFDSVRYSDADDFLPYIHGNMGDYLVTLERDKSLLPITLRRDPVLNYQRMKVMEEEYPKWGKTWARKRRDLKDQSLSGYDMALASMAVSAEWTDQDIADLLVAFRLQHGTEKDIKKAFRMDYVSGTIKHVRMSMERDQREQEMGRLIDKTHLEVQQMQNAPPEKAAEMPQDAAQMSTAGAAPEKPGKSPTTPKAGKKPDKASAPEPAGEPEEGDKRGGRLQVVSKALGITIIDLHHYEGDQVYFVLVLSVRGKRVEVPVGNSEAILTLPKLRRHVADHALVVIPQKIAGWSKLASILLSCAETRTTGETATTAGLIKEQVLSYLHQAKITKDWQGTAVKKVPFTREGKVYVYLAGLARFLAQNGERPGKKELGQQMRRAGLEPSTMAGFELDNGEKTTRSVFVVPDWMELCEMLVTEKQECSYED